ncbi:hypothetical protein V8V91_17860 [Algoriphagus halophilus]|uniref:DUF7507 domain-containing protein n=1 Tax=Algoriphagus halophilus TaxID=226505 RepID=UPI00358E4EB5
MITYTLMENTGNVTLDNVTVTDPLTGLNQVIGTLAPAATAMRTTTYTITQGDIDGGQVISTASVTGTDPTTAAQSTVATATVTAVQTPILEITKTADRNFYFLDGQVIRYTLEVENKGNVTLTDVVVTDNLTGFTRTVPTMVPGQARKPSRRAIRLPWRI